MACVLPSPTSAVGPVAAGLSLFGGFIGTTTQSDSSPPCAPDVRLDAFSGRHAVLLSGDAEVSRFSCMKFLSVRGVYDYAGSATGSRYRLLRCGLPHTSTGSAPQTVFSKLNTRPTNTSVYASKGTPRGAPCKTRGQDGSLLLSCKTFSFSASCRFIPALGRKRIAQCAQPWVQVAN